MTIENFTIALLDIVLMTIRVIVYIKSFFKIKNKVISKIVLYTMTTMQIKSILKSLRCQSYPLSLINTPTYLKYHQCSSNDYLQWKNQ